MGQNSLLPTYNLVLLHYFVTWKHLDFPTHITSSHDRPLTGRGIQCNVLQGTALGSVCAVYVFARVRGTCSFYHFVEWKPSNTQAPLRNLKKGYN